MKKIMSIIIAIGLSVVCCLGVFAESAEMETNVLRGAATCPSCDRGTLYDWQQKERFTTTFPCQPQPSPVNTEKRGVTPMLPIIL